MIQPRLVTDGSAWNEMIVQLPLPHPLQSEQWAIHKGRFGWRAQRWVYVEGDRARAAALLLRRRLGRLPLHILYAPKGPLLDDWEDSRLVDTVLSHLEHQARRQRAIFVKIDPDVDYPPAPDESAACGDALVARLHARRWVFSADQIQYRHTMLIDLRPDEEDLLAAMKSKTRYNIRLADRRGVLVRAGTPADLPHFYQLYRETSARDRFLIRESAYYLSAWEVFLEHNMGHLLLAEADGEVLAGVFLFAFGRRAWYVYGASGNVGRELMPNYLLQWEAMRWAKARGCTAYDLWGAPDELVESDPMWGVYRFKAGLGAHFVRHIGAYDYPAWRPLYWLYAVAIPRYLNLLRRRHGEPATLSDGGLS
jgi:peptidoglycan pentaglycine glycine transferase (the first glycine)